MLQSVLFQAFFSNTRGAQVHFPAFINLTAPFLQIILSLVVDVEILREIYFE